PLVTEGQAVALPPAVLGDEHLPLLRVPRDLRGCPVDRRVRRGRDAPDCEQGERPEPGDEHRCPSRSHFMPSSTDRSTTWLPERARFRTPWEEGFTECLRPYNPGLARAGRSGPRAGSDRPPGALARTPLRASRRRPSPRRSSASPARG